MACRLPWQRRAAERKGGARTQISVTSAWADWIIRAPAHLSSPLDPNSNKSSPAGTPSQLRSRSVLLDLDALDRRIWDWKPLLNDLDDGSRTIQTPPEDRPGPPARKQEAWAAREADPAGSGGRPTAGATTSTRSHSRASAAAGAGGRFFRGHCCSRCGPPAPWLLLLPTPLVRERVCVVDRE